jgi:serine O-acetyltransferase
VARGVDAPAPPVRPDLGVGMSLLAKLRADYVGCLGLERMRGMSLRRHFDVLTQVGFWSVVIFRISAAAHRAGLLPVARVLYALNIMLFGADLHPRARIGPGLVIPHPVGVGVGAGSRIGRDVLLLKGITLGTAGLSVPTEDGFPVIGDGCRIMDGAKLLGPIEVGSRALIGANALVMRSIPAGAIVASAPARIVRVEPPEDAPPTAS